MSPWQLAKNSEHSQQVALMQWCKMACCCGFELANRPETYTKGLLGTDKTPVPELKWIHAIPNGGLRDRITASKLVAEGVTKGIPDLCWPLPSFPYHGLYIEMKAPGKERNLSKEQIDFKVYAVTHNYMWVCCDNWFRAAEVIMEYYKSYRGQLPKY